MTVMLAVGAALAMLTACSHGDDTTTGNGSRPLTASQAERLAVFRFNAYQEGMVAVQGTIVGDQSLTINGWIDTARGRGYALVEAPQATHPGGFLTEWTTQRVSAQDYAGASAPLPPPDSGWQTTDLDPGTSALAAAQTLLVSLASDRPDNAQLLLQSGAQWLGSGAVDGVDVDIMSGPVPAGSARSESSFRYWIDADGNLVRIQARLDGLHLSTLDFSAAAGASF